MENVPVRKLALCEANAVVLRPNTPYVFEVIPGCKRCIELLDEANAAYSHIGESFDFTNPKTAVLPILANTQTIATIPPTKKGKASKK